MTDKENEEKLVSDAYALPIIKLLKVVSLADQRVEEIGKAAQETC